MYTWLILFVSAIIAYNFINAYLSYILLAVTIYKVLLDLHIVGETQFNSGTIKKSIVFFKKVVGPYKDSHPHFQESCNILARHNLADKYDYNTFGFYIDNPKKVSEQECRSCIGIMFTPSDRDGQVNKELLSYLAEKGWFSFEIPPTSAVVARFDLISYSFLMFVIIRYYKDLERSLCDKEFLNKMRFDPNTMTGIMEVCKANKVEFYIPTGNQGKFGLWNAELISNEMRE